MLWVEWGRLAGRRRLLLIRGIGGGAGERRPRESELVLNWGLIAGAGGSRETRGEELLVMMLSTTDAVLGRRDDGREEVSKLGLDGSLLRSVDGGVFTIGAREF